MNPPFETARAARVRSRGFAGGVAIAIAISVGVSALFLAAAPDAGAVSPSDRRFVSAKLGIRVDAPEGWTISTHTGYPSVIVLLLHPDGSRISIAVSETQAKSARDLVDLNRRGLEAQKLSLVSIAAGARGGVEVASRADARKESLVQLYMVRSLEAGARQAIVVSLFARTDVVAAHRPALDAVVGRLTLDPVEAAPNAKAGSAGERPAEKDRR